MSDKTTNDSIGGADRYPPDQEMILSLPHKKRIPYLETIYISSPRGEEILLTLQACYDRVAGAQTIDVECDSPPCKLLKGRFGVGKTALVKQLRRAHPGRTTRPTKEHPIGRKTKPVLYMRLPEKPTPLTLPTELLHAVGDPDYEAGTSQIKTKRLYRLLKEAETIVVIIDEAQHLMDQESNYILGNSTNWLKNAIKDTGLSFVLVGLEGEAEVVVESNGQLTQHFGKSEVLEPFRWVDLSPAEKAKPALARSIDGTYHEFMAFMGGLDAMLPFHKPSGLSDEDIAKRCFVASSGLMRPLMTLIRGAATLALQAHQECIYPQHLAESFSSWLAIGYVDAGNPFVGPCPEPTDLPPIIKRELKGKYRLSPNTSPYK